MAIREPAETAVAPVVAPAVLDPQRTDPVVPPGHADGVAAERLPARLGDGAVDGLVDAVVDADPERDRSGCPDGVLERAERTELRVRLQAEAPLGPVVPACTDVGAAARVALLLDDLERRAQVRPRAVRLAVALLAPCVQPALVERVPDPTLLPLVDELHRRGRVGDAVRPAALLEHGAARAPAER